MHCVTEHGDGKNILYVKHPRPCCTQMYNHVFNNTQLTVVSNVYCLATWFHIIYLRKKICIWLKTWLYIWVATDLATLWHLKLKIYKTSIEARKQRKKCFGNVSKEKSTIYRNIQLIKANYLIGRIEDKVRAPWMVFIECLQKYCQVHHCIILYVLECATGLCKIVFDIDTLDSSSSVICQMAITLVFWKYLCAVTVLVY
jgi:hypothetical protein